MKLRILCILLAVTGCETSQFGQTQQNPNVSPAYNKFYSDLLGGKSNGNDISNSLNNLMKGPTSQSGSGSSCGLSSFDFSNIDDLPENMVGFPLSISNQSVSDLNGEPQVMWDECDGIESNYNDGETSSGCKKRKVSKEFIGFFDKSFGKCVQIAAQGFSKDEEVEKIKFSHAGITGDTRHSSRSYHSVNRAMDIRSISFIQGGKTKSVKVSDQKKSPAKEFFESFRKCWEEQINDYKSNCPGKSLKGSIGHEDSDHQHHLHLSLPYCPNRHNNKSYYSK